LFVTPVATVVYGPGTLAVAHSKDEQIELAALSQAAAVLVTFLTDFCGAGR